MRVSRVEGEKLLLEPIVMHVCIAFSILHSAFSIPSAFSIHLRISHPTVVIDPPRKGCCRRRVFLPLSSLSFLTNYNTYTLWIRFISYLLFECSPLVGSFVTKFQISNCATPSGSLFSRKNSINQSINQSINLPMISFKSEGESDTLC
jgi:hypothetical protein